MNPSRPQKAAGCNAEGIARASKERIHSPSEVNEACESSTQDAGGKMASKFRYWQNRTLVASAAGYVAYYFVRKNLSVAMPGMQQDFGITKADLGLFLTLHGLLYGISKFVNGLWGDRVNARYFMVAGLVLSVLANAIAGFSVSATMFGCFWILNGWFQGMGFPPCARLLSHWYPPEKLATKMAIWNTSHSVGAGLVLVLCGYVVVLGWRWCFWVPAMISTAAAVALWIALRDTPRSVGLAELENTEVAADNTGESPPSDFYGFVQKQVFRNPFIWIVSMAQFFVYTLRYAVLDWGPTLLHEFKGYSLHNAGWLVAGFEISGVAGMLVAGWLTDRLFGGRGARMCVFCMALACLFLLLFWKMPAVPPWVSAMFLSGAGFFIYGPQSLVGTIATNLATKRAAATAIGFTSLFAYASTVLSGWGIGIVVERYGWNAAFGLLVGAGVLGMMLFILAWPAKAHGYRERV